MRIWEARDVPGEGQVVLARARCCCILSHNELWVLPWWDLRHLVTSKLGAQGADVILARAGDAAHGSKPTRAMETHGNCSLLPKTIRKEAEEGSVLAVQTPDPSAHAKHVSLKPWPGLCAAEGPLSCRVQMEGKAHPPERFWDLHPWSVQSWLGRGLRQRGWAGVLVLSRMCCWLLSARAPVLCPTMVSSLVAVPLPHAKCQPCPPVPGSLQG